MITQDLVGQKIGPYTLIKLIGSGGMAKIYLVRDAQQQLLALKMLLPHLQNQTEFTERFLREAQHAKILQHPHIVPIRDYQQLKDGTTFFVMDWIDGGSLADYVKPNKLSLAQISQIITQIASALDYAHQRGIVHRDLKPSNILLTPKGHALLADFGVAKVAQATTLTRPGEQPGTPAYMSPEQAQGIEVGPTSDIYALGIVLYELLAGHPPFQGDTSQILAVLYQHVHQSPPPLRQFNPHVSPAIEKVVMKALAKKPADRYSSAGEFAQALRLAINSPSPRSMYWVGYGLAASVMFSLCLGLAFVGWWFQGSGQIVQVTETPHITTLATESVAAEIQQPLNTSTALPTNLPPPPDEKLPQTLPLPQLLNPVDQSTIEATEKITLMWQWSQELGQDEQFQVTLKNNQQYNKTWLTRMTALTLPDPLSAGDYTWLVSVEARHQNGKYERLTLSGPFHFTVSAPPNTPTPSAISPTDVAEKLAAPILLYPPDQLEEATAREITFQWKSVTSLTPEQCYVLYINHRQGIDVTWLSDTRYVLGVDKIWLSSPQYGPDLSWQVVIAAKKGEQCEENHTMPQKELSLRSELRGFRWIQP